MFVEEAVALSLESRWEDALAVNRSLLEKHGPDEDIFNRMGKALTELGRHKEALDAYSEALRINPLNAIAQKNTRKLAVAMQGPADAAGAIRAIDVDLFAEEPGRSGLTQLKPPAAPVTAAIAPGDPVEIESQGSSLTARTERGAVLGTVEGKLARRLLPLIATGNRYTAAVARVDDRKIEIMIREAYQSPENSRKSSFPISRTARIADFRPYTKESLLIAREAAPVALSGNDDEGESVVAAPEDDGLELPALDVDDETVGLDDDEDKEVDEDVRPEDEY
jgi:tetratricopeptide (TPR) repeat protein